MSANFSGILSNFTNTTGIVDILSTCTIVNSSNLYTTTGPQQDGYFYLGSLLIQFSATTTNNSSIWTTINSNSATFFSFPIPYNSQPYNVSITSCSPGNTNACIQSVTNSGFQFLTQINKSSITWIAIGPRP